MTRRFRFQGGFTLIELLVVMVISGIIMTGVVAMFGTQTKATALQEDYVALEQNLRSAMDFVYRDSRIAGAYSKDALAPFTIGAIDYNADGTTDRNSEGGAGNSDALQLCYSPDPGLKITNHPAPANVNMDICAPSGLTVGQIIILSSNNNPPEVRSIQITNINDDVSCSGCPGTCDQVNFSPGPSALNSPGGLGVKYEGGRIWNNLETITYFQTDDADGNGTADDPALMRVRYPDAPVVVAYGITDFQVVYILRNGTETTAPIFPPPDDAQTTERLRLTVTGETRNVHAIGGTLAKRTRSMTTEVQVRNLAL